MKRLKRPRNVLPMQRYVTFFFLFFYIFFVGTWLLFVLILSEYTSFQPGVCIVFFLICMCVFCVCVCLCVCVCVCVCVCLCGIVSLQSRGPGLTRSRAPSRLLVQRLAVRNLMASILLPRHLQCWPFAQDQRKNENAIIRMNRPGLTISGGINNCLCLWALSVVVPCRTKVSLVVSLLFVVVCCNCCRVVCLFVLCIYELCCAGC